MPNPEEDTSMTLESILAFLGWNEIASKLSLIPTPSFLARNCVRAFPLWILITIFSATGAFAATFTVNSVNDPGNGTCDAAECTVREAVQASNASGAIDDIIVFDLPVGTIITITQGQLLITDTVTITGPGARNLTISGNGNSRIFQIEPILDFFSPDATVNISGLTLTSGNGAVTSLLGVPVTPGPGGAVFNTGGGTLNLTEMNISGNTIPLVGLIPENVLVGGGVGTVGTDLLPTRTNIIRSTIANNSAAAGGGGVSNVGTGLLLGARTTIVNSTITNNSTAAAGGGVLNVAGESFLTNNTISHNTSTLAGGGVVSVVGVLPSVLGVVNVRNNIIAENNAQIVGGILNLSNDVLGVLGSFNSQGNNLIGNNLNASANFAASIFVGGIPQPNAQFDIVGSVSVGTSVIDPRLGSITNNGGPTNTRALRSDSPALNAANNCVTFAGADPCDTSNTPPTQLTTDQRSTGFVRLFGAAVDIGAFERQGGDPVDQVYTVNSTADTTPNGCTLGNCTLREAVIAANANPGEDDIVFDPALSDSTITLSSGTGFGQLLITDSVSITGPNGCARNITVSGNNTSRVFQISPAVIGNDIQVRISSMTITNGNGAENTVVLILLPVPVVPGPGGAILNTGGGTLFLDDVNVSGNSTSLLGLVPTNSLVGGGIATVGTDLERTSTYISRSLFSDNSAVGGGGGIANVGTGLNILGARTFITNTTITNNGAGSLVDAAAGGGILNAAGTMFITNATVSHNRSVLLGGGIANVVGVPPVGAVYTRNSIYARNEDLLGLNLLFPDTAGIFISLGNNLVGNNGLLGLTVGLDANVTIVGGIPAGANIDIVGSIQLGFQTVDPLLGALQNNGGCTDTRALITGSPAIDRGDNCVTDGSCPTFNTSDPIFLWDQRSGPFTRIFDGNFDGTPTVDIGAYETQVSASAASVSIAGTVSDGTIGIGRILIIATDINGITKSARTNNFGRYTIDGLQAGETYIVEAISKGFVFDPLTVTADDDLTGVDFSPATEGKR